MMEAVLGRRVSFFFGMRGGQYYVVWGVFLHEGPPLYLKLTMRKVDDQCALMRQHWGVFLNKGLFGVGARCAAV